jgi:hypothetical protein
MRVGVGFSVFSVLERRAYSAGFRSSRLGGSVVVVLELPAVEEELGLEQGVERSRALNDSRSRSSLREWSLKDST